MGVDKRIVLTFGLTNLLFIACGAVTMTVSFMWRNEAQNSPSTGRIAQNIVFMMAPTMTGIATGLLTLLAGLSSIPPLATSTSRTWLRFHAWIVVVACVALLILGLRIWYLTLNEKHNLLSAFTTTNPVTIEALEEHFNCCGFFNSTSPPYVPSLNACPNDAIAASRSGCVTLLRPYADLFLNRLFTTLFGFVGIGTCAILAGAMLLKARAIEARYMRIAAKGFL